MIKIQEYKDEVFEVHFGVRPYQGERFSGDQVIWVRKKAYALMGIIDGLGHGNAAAEIAQQVNAYIEENHYQKLEQLVQNAHKTFMGSRGAVLGIAKIMETGEMEFVGLGNVTCRILGENHDLHLISKDGALGVRSRSINTTHETINNGERLIMYSDGVSNEISRKSYPLPRRGSKKLIENIIERFGKAHDDVSIIYLNKVHA